MEEIVTKSNKYASTRDVDGRTCGGLTWELFTISGLKAFMALALYMGMKNN